MEELQASSRATGSGCLLRRHGLRKVCLFLLVTSFIMLLITVIRPTEEVPLTELRIVGVSKDILLMARNSELMTALRAGGPPEDGAVRRNRTVQEMHLQKNHGLRDSSWTPAADMPQNVISSRQASDEEIWRPAVVQIPLADRETKRQDVLMYTADVLAVVTVAGGAVPRGVMKAEDSGRQPGRVDKDQALQREKDDKADTTNARNADFGDGGDRGKGRNPDGDSSSLQKERARLEEIQKSRFARIADVCHRNVELISRRRMWPYKMDRVHGLTYCPIPKAGWSSWKRVLFYINGVINSTDVEIGITPDYKAGVSDIGPGTLQRFEAMGQKLFVFSFVRNPWERLVSAYINKAVDWNYTRIMHSPCRWESMEPYNPPISFSQFLTCIADTSTYYNGLDIHWTPMWQLCDFCNVRYDYIGHMESVSADARYILEKNKLDVTFPRIFSSKAYRASDVLVDWYKIVPAEVILHLQRLYKLDFLLHDYSDVPPGWEGKLI